MNDIWMVFLPSIIGVLLYLVGYLIGRSERKDD